jgi:acyl-CoA thioester hydrolase
MSEPPPGAYEWAIAVQASDIDAQGHVSNVAIVGYLSQSAAEHSQSLGWGPQAYQDLGGMFVVRRHEIDYHRQATADDRLICWTWPSGLAKASAQRRYRLVRAEDQTLIAEGRTDWAFVDVESGRPKRIPPILRDTFDPARFE